MSEKAAVRVVEGNLVVPEGARIAIVASRFNHFIVDRLVEGALDAIARHGGEKAEVTLLRVPGSWEIPPVVSRLAKGGKVDDPDAVFARIKAELAKRDERDLNRPIAPGVAAQDAALINTADLSEEQVVEAIRIDLRQRGLSN